jgi:hypothetical protein
MKEAVCSVIYAAPFLENSPELVKVRALFLAKYGGQFPQECVNSCCVNKKVKDGLARNMPDEALISYYLSNIQDAHNLEDLGEPTEADPTDDDDNDIDTKLPTSTASASPAPAAASKKSVPAPAKASPSPKSTSPSTTSPTLQSSVGSVSRQGLLRKDMNGNFQTNFLVPRSLRHPKFNRSQLDRSPQHQMYLLLHLLCNLVASRRTVSFDRESSESTCPGTAGLVMSHPLFLWHLRGVWMLNTATL